MATFTPVRSANPQHSASAIRSLRVLAHINLRHARTAKKRGLAKLYLWHLETALDCRKDANALRSNS
jgi:hypothetical protein